MEDMNIIAGSSLEEIAACKNWKEENNVTGWMIPLYDAERNLVGEFQYGGGVAGGRILSYEEILEAKRNGWPNSKNSTLDEKESPFKSLEEAREAAFNGWSGNL